MSMKVLVADDSGVMRKIVIRALNSLGITDIVEAVDGVDALHKFAEHAFDLVLTDWNMPGKTGIEVLRAIRTEGHKLPIVLITTEAEKSRVLEAIQAGVSEYVTKPFDGETLQAKLNKFIDPAVV